MKRDALEAWKNIIAEIPFFGGPLTPNFKDLICKGSLTKYLK